MPGRPPRKPKEARPSGAFDPDSRQVARMEPPLLNYRSDVQSRIGRLEECGNFALLLYRFADGSTKDLCQVLYAGLAQRGDRVVRALAGLLDGIHRRQEAALTALFPQKDQREQLEAEVAWRLVIGTSYGKAWDTSLQVHPLYGVPYLPASGIKGMLAHFVKENYASDTDAVRIFGTLERLGNVVFFDSFCRSGARRYFEEDVIGKHYPDYYEQDRLDPREHAPADYCKPEPVKFLAVAGGVKFAFRFGSRHPELVGKTKRWLSECLAQYGIGAKTRVNYGRLNPAS